MTPQQYNRACEIKDRLGALAKVKKEIADMASHRLYFVYKSCDGDFGICPDWTMRPIAELLDEHELMIRQEIDDEIERLTKEIETL